VLVSEDGFEVDTIRNNFRNTVVRLLELGVIPIINENDVITSRQIPLRDAHGLVNWDNASLATLVARDLFVDVVIFLTDTPGLYTTEVTATKQTVVRNGGAPSFVDIISSSTNQTDIGRFVQPDSRMGKNGVRDVVRSALNAVSKGWVKAVVVDSGFEHESILKIVQGEKRGTLFVLNQATNVSAATPKEFQSKL